MITPHKVIDLSQAMTKVQSSVSFAQPQKQIKPITFSNTQADEFLTNISEGGGDNFDSNNLH